MAVIFLSLPPKLVLRACVFVPVLQGQRWATVWVSQWESSRSNIKTRGDHCQKWQGRAGASGMETWWRDVADADSQLSAHLQGLLFVGQGCDQAPGERRGSAGDASDGRREVLRVDAVIAGSVEESDTAGLGSADNTLGDGPQSGPGCEPLPYSTTATARCHTNTCVNSAYTPAELMCRFLLCVCV